MTRVHVRYFASLREALGPSEEVDVADGTDVAGLRRLLVARGGRFSEVLAEDRAVRCALDRVMANDAGALLREGAEVAFFPPVTGG